MLWQRLTTLAALFLTFGALAAWQWDEYGHECGVARETVSSSADSVMNALVGGIRSHRRLNPPSRVSVTDRKRAPELGR